MSRAVEPHGSLIARMRDDRLWDQAQLAHEAKVSLRTIQSVESGKSCFRYTINKVAVALGIDASMIVKRTDKVVLINIGQPTGASVPVQIVINGTTITLDETQLVYLLAELKRQIKARGDIDVTDIHDGSVVITCEIDLSDLMDMLRLDSRDLRQLGITEIRLPAGLRIQMPDRTGRLRIYSSDKQPPFDDPDRWYTV